MKIDIFTHYLPMKYKETFLKKLIPGAAYIGLSRDYIGISDLDVRFRIMDRFPDVLQVLTTGLPPLENRYVKPKNAIELAKIANDEMAELIAKYPDRFITAVACLPMNDIDAAMKETDRATSFN